MAGQEPEQAQEVHKMNLEHPCCQTVKKSLINPKPQ